uniref:Uncharacterized protein n=1 Tax=Arundo donax TaxID=35708 RepID=A0A0A9EW04_ARUDO
MLTSILLGCWFARPMIVVNRGRIGRMLIENILFQLLVSHEVRTGYTMAIVTEAVLGSHVQSSSCHHLPLHSVVPSHATAS